MSSAASSKAKGTCRRCKSSYERTFVEQKVCDSCRNKCSTCNVELTELNQDKRSLELRKSFRCKACVAEGVRKTPNRKSWQKNYDLLRSYGITLEEFEKLSYNGCSICSSKEKLVVDHSHSTGKVRGVLCQTCNTGLGMFKDSPSLLEKASQYIKDTEN